MGVNRPMINKSKSNDGQKVITSQEHTLQYCQELVASHEGHITSKTPLRCRWVVIHGPSNGYLVCELGFALRNDFSPIR